MSSNELYPQPSRPEQGDETVFSSVCRICHGGCGVLVTVKDGKVVNVRGDSSSPLNAGWMCIKGSRTPEIANHPDRLWRPLKRSGARETNQWSPISWEQALDEIAARIDAFRTEPGAQSVVIAQGTGRHHYMHTVRFANALGTPNWCEPGFAQCLLPRITVSHLTCGDYLTPDYDGHQQPKCILFWGHNPLITGPDGELACMVRRALDKGALGIAVDPRRSETARRCRLWLPIRPGTDAALALAMINVIIQEGLFDREFVENWTSGFAALSSHVAPCTPEWAAQITGIDREKIVEAARMYAQTKPAVLEWGVGIEQNANSLHTVHALTILRALAGNIDVPGGDILAMNILRPYPILRNRLSKEMAAQRLGREFNLLAGPRAYMPSAHIPSVYKAMREGKPYPIKAMLVFGSNPLTTVANARGVQEALRQLDLLVVVDLFMTPTAAMADYVLPAAFWTEVEQIAAYPVAAHNLVMAQQKTSQLGECRQDEWIIDELSQRLKLPDSHKTFKDLIEYQLEPLGIEFNELTQLKHVAPPHTYRKYRQNGFRTRSRKIELYSTALERMGYEPLPAYKEPPESPISRPDLIDEFPYILITGSRKREYFHSEGRQIASFRKSHPNPVAEIHTKAALANGIRAGDWILVKTAHGSARMKAAITDDIHEQVVSVEHGWWFPEKEGYGIWESNANVLTSDQPPYDIAFGSCRLRGLLCNIKREGD